MRVIENSDNLDEKLTEKQHNNILRSRLAKSRKISGLRNLAVCSLLLAYLTGCKVAPKPMPVPPPARTLEMQIETEVDFGKFGFAQEIIEEEPIVSQVYTAKFDLEDAKLAVKGILTKNGIVQSVRPDRIIVTDAKDNIPGIDSLMSELGYKTEKQILMQTGITNIYACLGLDRIMPLLKSNLSEKGSIEVVGADKLVITDTEQKLDYIKNLLAASGFEAGEKITKGNLVTRLYAVRNRDLESVKQVIAGRLGKQGSVQEIKPDRLIIKDTPMNQKSLEKLLDALDNRVPQVMIESSTYEVFSDVTADYSAFLSWRGRNGSSPIPSLEVSLPSIPSAREDNIGTILGYIREGVGDLRMGEVKLFLDFLVSEGKAKIVSKPWISVESGKKAEIATGDRIPYRAYQVVSGTESFITQYEEALIKLEVTPYVKEEGRITMEIMPQVNTITGFKGPEQMPLISERIAKTTITIKSGETYVIGGLTKEEDREVRRGIPLLMDIPILGNLFKSLDIEKSKTDIYISITPRLVGYTSSPKK